MSLQSRSVCLQVLRYFASRCHQRVANGLVCSVARVRNPARLLSAFGTTDSLTYLLAERNAAEAAYTILFVGSITALVKVFTVHCLSFLNCGFMSRSYQGV